jgi:hypothetical protein
MRNFIVDDATKRALLEGTARVSSAIDINRVRKTDRLTVPKEITFDPPARPVHTIMIRRPYPEAPVPRVPASSISQLAHPIGALVVGARCGDEGRRACRCGF